MNILRKIKLYRLGIIVDDLCLRVIKFIDKNILNLTEFKDPDYPEYIFYMKGGKNMFQYDIKSHYLYVRHDGLWDVFSRKFNVEYVEIQQIFKYLIEENYKIKVKTVDRKIWF